MPSYEGYGVVALSEELLDLTLILNLCSHMVRGGGFSESRKRHYPGGS